MVDHGVALRPIVSPSSVRVKPLRQPPQSKRGGGDRSSRPAQVRARENEQKALSLWIKGATYEQLATAGFDITSASGLGATRRALARIPKAEPIRHAKPNSSGYRLSAC
jgi:hypothetical protein